MGTFVLVHSQFEGLYILMNASRRQELFHRWTVPVELSACRITWQRYLTCTV